MTQQQSTFKKLLLVSSWQTFNIGDIAHTPGVLTLLEKYLPGVEVTLWPGDIGDGVKEMLAARFPKLKFVEDEASQNLACQECDFLLHGSGPYLVASEKIKKWLTFGKKPYGVFGITYTEIYSQTNANQEIDDLLSGAEFVYFRDSASLAVARSKGVHSQVMEWGPDGAFACDLKNETAAKKLVEKYKLEVGKFLCCTGKLRWTPYWNFPEKKSAFNQERHDLNEQLKENDHVYLREAIVQVVRQTDLKVLLCPEDKSQMKVNEELIYQPLPDDVKNKVVLKKDFWLTDEALSVYRLSAGFFGNEQHSPIMCIGNGIPAVVCRWKEQTSKGFMWEDIGRGEWLFDTDDKARLSHLPKMVLEIATHPNEAKAKTLLAKQVVDGKFNSMTSVLKKCLSI
jgi:polysaccharide pyruvyl transferase WcaK-like protein